MSATLICKLAKRIQVMTHDCSNNDEIAIAADMQYQKTGDVVVQQSVSCSDLCIRVRSICNANRKHALAFSVCFELTPIHAHIQDKTDTIIQIRQIDEESNAELKHFVLEHCKCCNQYFPMFAVREFVAKIKNVIVHTIEM